MSIFSNLDRESTLKLLPCPHCGGRPTGVVWLEHFVDSSGFHVAKIVCAQCNSIMNTNGLSKESATQRAIEKWNQRWNGLEVEHDA